MKTTHRLSALLVMTLPFTSLAQTNTFPPSGSVGIGTTSPQQKFVVSNAGAEGLEVYLTQPAGVVGLQSYDRSVNQYKKMQFDASQFAFMQGNVGIGTTSPYKKLHLYGTGDVEQMIETSNDGYASFSLKSNGKMWHWSKHPSYEGDALRLFYHDGNSWQPPYMSIATNGYIGMGISFPQAPLHLVNNTNTQSLLLEGNSPGWGSGLVFKNTAPGGKTYGIYASASGSLNISDNAAMVDRLFISAFGNVGIGTTTPQAKLAVNGDILSKKVKVTQTGWADYVFEPTYKLPTLKEVEAFIQQHKHLPEVPSAKEVAANGLDLGDNQAVLLKKIEELTLYVIEQNKKIENQQRQIKDLQEVKKEIELIKASFH